MPRKKKKAPLFSRLRDRLSSVSPRVRRFWIGGCVAVVLLGAVTLLADEASARLDRVIERRILEEIPHSQIVFVDLPPAVSALAEGELRSLVEPFTADVWTEETLCRRIGAQVRTSGWIESLRHVRRKPDGRIEISARYRLPVASVPLGAGVALIDAVGTRLPGTFAHQPSWPVVVGVKASAPPPGDVWVGEDLQAALDLLAVLGPEEFAPQVAGVDVRNFGGRLDGLLPHIDLLTDRAGGRIRWGSAIGREVEENAPAQKIALLRTNFHQTGRIDGGYSVIDVSTYANEVIVAGE